jgi:hypothetical protein
MSTPPRVFLETSALKYASERVLRAYRIAKLIRWGRADVAIPMLRCYAEYPNEALGWTRRHQWLQAMALPILAWLAREGRVDLLCTEAVRIELSGLPRTDNPRGLFYGACSRRPASTPGGISRWFGMSMTLPWSRSR